MVCVNIDLLIDASVNSLDGSTPAECTGVPSATLAVDSGNSPALDPFDPNQVIDLSEDPNMASLLFEE